MPGLNLGSHGIPRSMQSSAHTAHLIHAPPPCTSASTAGSKNKAFCNGWHPIIMTVMGDQLEVRRMRSWGIQGTQQQLALCSPRRAKAHL
eukprot:1141970-Pelagomonas_calceolata.AAC.6